MGANKATRRPTSRPLALVGTGAAALAGRWRGGTDDGSGVGVGSHTMHDVARVGDTHQDAPMHVAPELTVRRLTETDFPAARRLLAVGFADEPFAFGMFGESPIARLVGMADQYAEWPWDSESIVVGAVVDGNVLGAALATLPGACDLCEQFSLVLSDNPSQAESVDYEFQLICRAWHLNIALPPHAHIRAVVTEPYLHGTGIGRMVMRGLLAGLWSAGTRCAVLECVTARERFYSRCGLRRIAEFDDPGGPSLRSVLMRVDSP